jgi:serine/threonine-protein kinase
LDDIFEIQDEITLAIVDALKVKFLGKQRPDLIKRYTSNAEAYQLYLNGRYHYNKWTEDGFRKAIDFYRQAVDLDPDYSPAHAEIANCLGTLLYFGYLVPNETLPAISAAVEKAITIDDSVVEAHITLAKIKFYYEWDFAGAQQEFKRAIELNPNHSEAHLFYAFYLAVMGRFDEALAEVEVARELDPISLICNLLLGHVYLIVGRHDLMAEQSKRLLRMEPDFYGSYYLSGTDSLLNREYEEAIASYRKAITLGSGPAVMGAIGYAYGASGKREEALRVLEELNQLANQQYIPSYYIALVYAGLDEMEEALKWLDKAIQERNGPLATLNRDVFFNRFHAEPRFQELLRKIGLPQ